MHARLYAGTYFADIAGMVLVDSSEETWLDNWWQLDPLQSPRSQAFAPDPKALKQQDDCVKAAEAGFVEGSEISRKCLSPADDQFSDAINSAYHRTQMSAGYQRAAASEFNNYQHSSSDQVLSARRWYGDMPLVVLTASPREHGPKEAPALQDALNRVHAVFADRLAALSRRDIVRVEAM